MTIVNLARLAPRPRTDLEDDRDRERLVAAQSGLIVHDGEPLNCETPPDMLGGRVTPTAQFYRRCHFGVPVVDETTWRLEVGGLVDRPLSLSLHDLTQLPAETMVVTLECAGNDRARLQPSATGVPWGPGAVSTAEWTGPRLDDVLRRAGIRLSAREVVFRGADRGPVEDRPGEIRFERSLPVGDALGAGALLAYAVNGRPLPARHGYPLRLVVPGWYGMASVKWLNEIQVTAEPFRGFFQGEHYVYERAGRPGAGPAAAGPGPDHPARHRRGTSPRCPDCPRSRLVRCSADRPGRRQRGRRPVAEGAPEGHCGDRRVAGVGIPGHRPRAGPGDDPGPGVRPGRPGPAGAAGMEPAGLRGQLHSRGPGGHALTQPAFLARPAR